MQRPWGVGYVARLPLVSQADTKIFKTTPTIAAADAKFESDRQASTTLVTKTRLFTSGGTYVMRRGDTITGATSAATARVIGFILTSGTFAGGDAAGILFLEVDSGTFQSENLNVGANSNVATIGGALSSAGIFNETSLGWVGVAVSSVAMQCQIGQLQLHDASGAEWADSGDTVETTGHEDADDPLGCVWTDTIASGTGQGVANIRASGAPVAPAALPGEGFYFEVVAGTHVGYNGYVKTAVSGGTTDVVPYKDLPNALTTGDVVKYFRAARVPSHVAAIESGVVTSIQANLALEATAQSILTDTATLPTDPADASDIATATNAILARCLTAAAALRMSDREAAGGTITVSAGSHTTLACVASNGASGTRTKGRAGLVVSGGIVNRAIRFTSDVGAAGAFTYTDLYGNAVPVALAEADVIQW